ncbi:MAG: hypothetical protein WA081_03955 [Desulfosalsimonadaceae bacterium]
MTETLPPEIVMTTPGSLKLSPLSTRRTMMTESPQGPEIETEIENPASSENV